VVRQKPPIIIITGGKTMTNGKMKERLKGAVMGFLLCSVLFSATAVVANQVRQRDLHFTGVRIFVDGAEIVPRDGAGNLVEPFIMDGTTYLPVRAVANALGVLVDWDGATQSVFLFYYPCIFSGS
jgi:hypothetical protein